MADYQSVFEGDSEDLEIITAYLADELSPEQKAVVERRLADDEAFREIAEPLIWLWSIQPDSGPHTVSRAELERSWDEITRKTGFLHQRRQDRNVRIFVITFTLVTLGSFAVLLLRR